LPAREELLFKSLVRLLDHKTHQSWLYFPHCTNVRADLLIVAKGIIPPADVSQNGSLQQVLTLAVSGSTRDFFLCLPLRANELEAELNRLGGLIQGALMTGRAITVDSLQKVSGASLPTCSEFIDDLRRADLMQELASPLTRSANGATPASAQTTDQSGLLSRIRQRLGIQLFGGT
jgi:hypothetical protein